MNSSDCFKFEQAVRFINATYKRVLISDCYEGYELRTLIASLEILLDEANKK